MSELVLTAGGDATGYFVVSFSEDTFWVYDSDKETRIAPGAELLAGTDRTLYIRGVAADEGMCKGETISVSYSAGENPVSDNPDNRLEDAIKINVSEIQIEVNDTPDSEKDDDETDHTPFAPGFPGF